MKRTAMDHPKLLHLHYKLGVDKPTAVGILECLWHFAAQYTPDGRVGKYAPAGVAARIGYTKDPVRLFHALEECGWLDRTDRGWVIHDWADHCEDTVHLRLARAGGRFADGRMPSLSRLNARERKVVLARYHEAAQNAGAQGEADAQPSPAADPKPHDGDMPRDATPVFMCAHAVRTAHAEAEAEAEAVACAHAEPDTDADPGKTVGSASANASADKQAARSAVNIPATGPVSAAELVPALLGGLQVRREDLPGRILRATADGPAYADWWRRVVRLMHCHDGADTLFEALRHVEDCANPAVRAAKDLGELRAPGAYLASRCRDHLARRGIRLPAPPRQAA